MKQKSKFVEVSDYYRNIKLSEMRASPSIACKPLRPCNDSNHHRAGFVLISKNKRQHIFLNQVKRRGYSSIKAANRAKLIPNLNPDNVLVLKVCG